MAAHGTISEFSSAQETLTSYIEHLEQYLAAKLKIQTSREQYYSVSVAQQLTDLSTILRPPRSRQS